MEGQLEDMVLVNETVKDRSWAEKDIVAEEGIVGLVEEWRQRSWAEVGSTLAEEVLYWHNLVGQGMVSPEAGRIAVEKGIVDGAEAVGCSLGLAGQNRNNFDSTS